MYIVLFAFGLFVAYASTYWNIIFRVFLGVVCGLCFAYCLLLLVIDLVEFLKHINSDDFNE